MVMMRPMSCPYLVLEVSNNMQLANPTVSARIHNRTPEKFLMKCGEAIRTHGGGHPALFNDEVIIPSQLANVPGITKEDAYDYSVIGCSEIAFGGKGTEGIAGSRLERGQAPGDDDVRDETPPPAPR